MSAQTKTKPMNPVVNESEKKILDDAQFREKLIESFDDLSLILADNLTNLVFTLCKKYNMDTDEIACSYMRFA